MANVCYKDRRNWLPIRNPERQYQSQVLEAKMSTPKSKSKRKEKKKRYWLSETANSDSPRHIGRVKELTSTEINFLKNLV